jgi:hypothetical protein
LDGLEVGLACSFHFFVVGGVLRPFESLLVVENPSLFR